MARNKQQAQEFLASIGVKDQTTVIPVEADLDAVLDCMGHGLVNLEQFKALAKRREQKAADDAAASARQSQGKVELRLSRTGNAISFYRGGKHVVSPTPDNLRLILDNAKLAQEFLASEQIFYYKAVPTYSFRGKLQPAKSAAVVIQLPGKSPLVLASGAEADAEAAKRGLKAINPDAASESAE